MLYSLLVSKLRERNERERHRERERNEVNYLQTTFVNERMYKCNYVSIYLNK